MKIKQFTPVVVEWNDATSEDDGWVDYDSVNEELLTVASSGFFFSQNKESITLVQSYFKDEYLPRVSGSITIPKKIIKKMTTF